jgi:23S rRNA pseudouridine1911/1915/1917 synthase
MYLEPEIIYEDENIVALFKPAGLLMHSDGKREGETLVDWLLIQYPEVAAVGDKPGERPGIVHRLDKNTSGVVVVARNQETFMHIKSLFKQRKVKKIYRALVNGVPKNKSGEIDTPISIKDGSVKRTVYKGKMGKEAITQFKVLKELGEYAYLEVQPKTGRTHQIRVHLASIGHPVLGDTLYGKKGDPSGAPRQMLHAYSLELETKPGKVMRFQTDLPDDFNKMLKSLEK